MVTISTMNTQTSFSRFYTHTAKIPKLLLVFVVSLMACHISESFMLPSYTTLQFQNTASSSSSSSSTYCLSKLSIQTRQLRLLSSSDDNNENQKEKYDQGEVGKGPNWIEKSFPVETEDKINIKKVEDYNLGICGKDFQTGSLSKRMFDTIISRTSLGMSDEIKQAFTLYAMDFTAKEAARAALKSNGLDMTLQEEEEDQGMWGDIEAVRLYDPTTEKPLSKMYDSLEEAVEDWTPGQTFDFVARQVPAKIRELTIEELVQALDPDGSLREEAKELRGEDPSLDEESLLSIFDDEEIASLADLASDCVRRTEEAPRQTTDNKDAFAGADSKGYRLINRSDLLRDSINQDGTENKKSKLMNKK